MFCLPVIARSPLKLHSLLNHTISNQLQFSRRPQLWRRRMPIQHITSISLGFGGFGLELFRIVEKITDLLDKGLLLSRLVLRTAVLGVLFIPCFASFPLWYYFSASESIDDHPKSIWWLNYLTWTLEVSGPTWIKIGQWSSSRTDLFPQWACQVLAKLQDNVYPHPYSHTRRVLESTFLRKVDDIFEEFDPRPIGVGAVAQVYKGRLKNSEEYVAVKVLHPNVAELVELDLTIMSSIASLIEFVIPESHWLSLPEEVAIFGSMMRQQMDLSNEGRNLSKFTRNFEKWNAIGFPEPRMTQYSNKNLLIETWIDGIPMQKFLKWNRNIYDRSVATLGLTSFLKMLILDNHLHADLHPGNILVSFQNDDGDFLNEKEVSRLSSIDSYSTWAAELERLHNESYTPYVFYLDAGLTCSLSPEHLTNFIDLFKAITDFDGLKISSLMVERSKTPWSVVNFDDFKESMSSFMADIRRNAFTLKHMEVSDILRFVFSTVRKHHVKIDGEFANIGVAIMLMEGVGKQLEPDMDLLQAAVPFLSEAIRLRMKGNVSETEKGFIRYWKNRIFGG